MDEEVPLYHWVSKKEIGSAYATHKDGKIVFVLTLDLNTSREIINKERFMKVLDTLPLDK